MRKLWFLPAFAAVAVAVPSLTHAAAGPTNLALGSVATASSVESSAYPASNAVEAWELMERADGGARFDAVFSDIVLPGAMNGVQLARRLRERRPEVAVVLVSGYNDAMTGLDDAEPSVEVLRKPYVMEDLGHALERALDRAAAETRGATGTG